MDQQKLRRFIDENLVELNLDNFSENFDPDFVLLDELFASMIGPELKKIFSIQDKFNAVGDYIIKKETVQEFLEKLFTLSCPRLLKYNAVSQQCYLLYVFANLLFRYNKQTLKLTKEEFINRIYFKNILTLCSKYLIHCRRLLYRIIRRVYLEMEGSSKEILDFYVELYHADEGFIKNELLHHFLISLVTKFNPLSFDDLDEFYSSIFRRILYFYLKAKTSGMTTLELDPTFIQDNTTVLPSERYRIYEEALYLAQIQMMCVDSATINQISGEYDKLKNIVIPNELQRLYLFALENGKFSTNNDKMALLQIHSQMEKMDEIKTKIPHIYRLLRSVHIKTNSPTLIEHDITLIRDTVYTTLHSKFKNVLAEEVLMPVLRNIAENLIRSLTVGEFIDMITLTRINLSGEKFAKQLQVFLEMILSGINTDVAVLNGESYG